ncbi:MAG: hypothetical protein IIC78_09520 [Chloroflexi bacterium]|nr:hypothetical protein [Chloroflexota bacterium]
MSGLFVGAVVGLFIGIGLMIFCLAKTDWFRIKDEEEWIDEALEQAVEALDETVLEF